MRNYARLFQNKKDTSPYKQSNRKKEAMRNESAKYFKRFTVESKNEVVEKLDELCAAKGLSRTKLVNIMIAEYFENHNIQ